jgi:Holliday junction DNA helicase RuvA
MYYYLNGTHEYRDINTCVIDCAGVGYKLTVSLITSELCASKMGQKIKLFTYLAIRENEIELFGFNSNEERLCFNQLISVSGVGPKAAMSILSIMTPDKFSLAVCTEDVKAISKASGIGTKTAARIVLELKDKISKDMMGGANKFDIPSSAAIPQNTALGGKLNDALQALLVLGLDKNTAMNALKGIDATGLDSGEIVKAALKKLNQK